MQQAQLVRFVFAVAVGVCASAQDLQQVTGVEAQPLLAQVVRLKDALDYVGSSLPADDTARLLALRDEKPSKDVVVQVQKILDPYCLAMVDINPEARVKTLRGPAKATLLQHGWKSFLVKVHNGAGLTGALAAVSPNTQPLLHRSRSGHRPRPKHRITAGQAANRFLEMAMFHGRPMRKNLSGLKLEYAIVQLYCKDAGKREARIGFHVGRGSQDLAFRNAIDVLFDCAAAVKVILRVKDEDGRPTIASFTITDGIERLAVDRAKRPMAVDYRHQLAIKQPWDVVRRGGRRLKAFPYKRLHGVYPLPARRLVRDGYPDFFFQPQVYRADGEHVLLTPGEYQVIVRRGPEYKTQHRTIRVPETKTRIEVAFELERWTHLKKLGWYSADHHVHAAGCSHYESPEEGVRPEDMWRQAMGEDLNVACVLTWGPCWYHQKQHFEGKSHKLSNADYLMRYDVEVSGFPSSHAGHLCLLRLKEDDYPNTKRVEDWPSWTLPILQWAKKQGGVVAYAHSGWGLEPKTPTDEFPNYVPAKFNGIGANEYIVTVTHDAVDFFSAGDTPLHWELNIWYHTLNVGFRTRISGETDFPCIFDERVGMIRTYAKLDGALEFDKYVDKIKAGRSYVSDGKAHIVDFRVDDVELGVGASELRLPKAKEVRVTANVTAWLPEKQDMLGAYIAGRPQDEPPYWDIERSRVGKSRTVAVELVINGKAADKKTVVADGKWSPVSFTTKIEHSSWVALRVKYSCHTNPIFALIDNRPIRASRRSAEWCRQGVDQCWRKKSRRIRKSEHAAAKAAYDKARQAYDRLIRECRDDRQ